MDDLRGTLAWALAERQCYLLTWTQLIDLGFTPREIRTRLRTKRLWPVYPGVYAVGHGGMTPERERMAAVLACGEGAALSHFSAAVHTRVWEGTPPARHHVSIPDRSGRRGAAKLGDEAWIADRILVHRPRRLTPGEIVIHEGIPTTSITRTLTDLAQYLKPWQLKKPMRQAERVHGYDLRILRDVVGDAPRSAWRAQRVRRALAYVLDDSGTTQTEREALYLDICRRHRVPRPEPQRAIGARRADFVHEALKLIVEIDDRSSHDGHVAFLEDRRRDRVNANRGYETIRFTVAECRHEPKLVAADSLAAIARRVAHLGLDPRAWGLGRIPAPAGAEMRPK